MVAPAGYIPDRTKWPSYDGYSRKVHDITHLTKHATSSFQPTPGASKEVHVCNECVVPLRKKKVSKFCRKGCPLPDEDDFSDSLNISSSFC